MPKSLAVRVEQLAAALHPGGAAGATNALIRRAQAELEAVLPADVALRERVAEALFRLDAGGAWEWPPDAPPVPPLVAALVAEQIHEPERRRAF